MALRKIAILVSLLSFVTLPGEVLGNGEEVHRVSLVNLIADPAGHHGKTVLVKGYYVLAMEESALYLSKEAAEFGISDLAYWIDFGGSSFDPSAFTGKYVSLIGVVEGKRAGSWKLNPGAVRSIRKIRVLERRSVGSE